jgi:hypothetical protein
MIRLLTSVLFIMFFNLAGAQGIYVDAENGSDETGVGNGTLAKPYRTISHASKDATAGKTIYLRKGTYRERAWINFSGTPGNPIVITAYQNEDVTISGLDLIKTPWVLSDHPSGKVWKTPMPFTRNSLSGATEAGNDQVFVDGEMQVEARWPNLPANTNPAVEMLKASSYATAETGQLLGGPYGENAPAFAQYKSAQALPSANLSGAYMNFIPGARWAPATGKITSHSGDNLTFQYRFFKVEDNNTTFHKPRNDDIFYLWGKYELLDAPGEWFRKPDNGGMLYLYAPNGVDPNNHIVEIKPAVEERAYAFWFFDKRSYITIKNIKIKAATISAYKDCTDIIVDNVDMKYATHASFVPGWYNAVGSASISLDKENSLVTNCNIAYNAGGGIVIKGDNSKAINNVIHDTGYSGIAGSSIECTSGSEMEVRNNTAWGVGSANVIDYRFAKKSKILYNEAFKSGTLTFDGGILMGAVIRDINNPSIVYPVYAENTEVAYNYIHDGLGLTGGDFYGTSGIYFEGKLNDYLIHHNVIWNVGAGINMPDANYSGFKIYNNTLYNEPLILFNKSNIFNVELKNNIFTEISDGGYGPLPNVTIQKNLTTVRDYSKGSITYPDNKFAPDPKYTDAANLNFVPTAGSPLINAGLPLAPFTNGFAGTAPDIGAFESGKLPFIAGALVRPQDVANITVTYDNTAFPNKKFTISGLPEGRKIGLDFKLKIGNAQSGGIMQYDYATNQVSFTNVPKESLTGVQPISLDMGTEGVHATNSTIDLSNLSVYSIAVYPNPSRGDFFIRIPQEYQDKEVKIRVYALDGKLILDKTLDHDKAEGIKLTAKGIYILKTTIESQTFTNKIFVN